LTYENHKSVPKKLAQLFIADLSGGWCLDIIGRVPSVLFHTRSRLRLLTCKGIHVIIASSDFIRILGLFDIVISTMIVRDVLRGTFWALSVLLKRVLVYFIIVLVIRMLERIFCLLLLIF
jgi:hypothetical protein